MSLLGRLEDLSLTDIVQIVYLSRRTGILEIIDQTGRYTVLFQHGLIVNASSPDRPDLGAYLVEIGALKPELLAMLRQAEATAKVPIGAGILEMNVMSPDDLADAIFDHVSDVVTRLVPNRDGEFNFILSDAVGRRDIEYDPDFIFKEGGISPQRLLGTDGEKLKPLRGLEETMKVGKALLRGTPAGASASPAPVDFGLGSSPAAPPPANEAQIFDFPAAEEAPFAELDDASAELPSAVDPDVAALLENEEPEPFSFDDDAPPAAEFPPASPPPTAATTSPTAATGAPASTPSEEAAASPAELKPAAIKNQFKVAVDPARRPFEGAIVLYEHDALVRVAAKRAFSRKEISILQFGAMADARETIATLLRENQFFVSFLDLDDPTGGNRDTLSLVQLIKRRNQRLPVVVLDPEANLRRRHDMLKAGADLYLTKPSATTLRPGSAEEELSLFADELVLFAERSLMTYQQGPTRSEERGRLFYEDAGREKTERTMSLLRQLINEVSNPGDLSQLTSMILRLASEYLDRGVLFAIADGHFLGLGGFGNAGAGPDVNHRVRRIRIPRSESSVLSEVIDAKRVHQGKIRRTTANVQLIEGLGALLPTEVVSIPIRDGEKVVGVFYGDNAEHRVPIGDLSGLGAFLAQAGQALGRALEGVMWAEK